MKLEEIKYPDMHTHCEYSRDSVCEMEEMCLAQIEKGTKVFAVTDHFDTGYYLIYDMFSSIKASNEKVSELKEKYGDKIHILAGVEIGEGFWHPEQCEKIMRLCDYDVVIGSVHLIKYKGETCSLARNDVSKFTREMLEEYVNVYFDDMLTMIDTVDFDILAHLTLPLRYINGKYNFGIDLSCYEQKIERILDKIIQKGIALEVNTSSYKILGEAMPCENILRRYYEKGGYLITLGSDAHSSNQAAQFFDDAIEVIKKVGFKQVYYYKKRKPYAINIEK